MLSNPEKAQLFQAITGTIIDGRTQPIQWNKKIIVGNERCMIKYKKDIFNGKEVYSLEFESCIMPINPEYLYYMISIGKIKGVRND